MNGHCVFNTSYEILTPSGWCDFAGVKQSFKQTIAVKFSDNSTFICTPDHILLVNGDYKRAGNLLPTELVCDKRVVSVTLHRILDVYDPVEVKNGNLYFSDGIISHNCQFLGSSGTLINANKIGQLSPSTPLYSKDGVDIHEYPIRAIRNPDNTVRPAHTYALVADVSRGIGGDYSAFTVIDITKSPYKVVAKYRDNMVNPLLFPNIIYKIAKDFNNAYVLIEIKENGQQVADILQYELEYENVLHVTRGGGGQHLTAGFGSRQTVQNGVMTSAQVKRIGCDAFKALVEEDKLLISDTDIISEIATFIEVKNSYAADEGYNDDLCMCLVLFGWITTNPFFKDLTNLNIRERMYAARMEDINNSLTPFGGYDNGRNRSNEMFEDSAGNKWDLLSAKEQVEEFKWLFG